MTRQTDETYEVAAFPSPEALGSWLLHRRPDSGDTARIAAGYCWQWTDPVVVDGDKTLVVAVLPGGGPPGSVPVTAMWLSQDLAAPACPLFDISVEVAGTGLAHQLA